MKDLVENTLLHGNFIESTAQTLSPGMIVTDLAGFDLGDQPAVVMKTETRLDSYVVWVWMTESDEIRKLLLPKDTAYQAKEPPDGMLHPEPYDLEVLDELGDLPAIRTLPESYWPDDPNYESPLTETIFRPTYRRYPYYRYYETQDMAKLQDLPEEQLKHLRDLYDDVLAARDTYDKSWDQKLHKTILDQARRDVERAEAEYAKYADEYFGALPRAASKRTAAGYWDGHDMMAAHMGIDEIELPDGLPSVPAETEEHLLEKYQESLRDLAPDPKWFLDAVKYAVSKELKRIVDKTGADLLDGDISSISDDYAHEEWFAFVGGVPEYSFQLDYDEKEMEEELGLPIEDFWAILNKAASEAAISEEKDLKEEVYDAFQQAKKLALGLATKWADPAGWDESELEGRIQDEDAITVEEEEGRYYLYRPGAKERIFEDKEEAVSEAADWLEPEEYGFLIMQNGDIVVFDYEAKSRREFKYQDPRQTELRMEGRAKPTTSEVREAMKFKPTYRWEDYFDSAEEEKRLRADALHVMGYLLNEGSTSLTALAELAAVDLDHDEWLEDDTHPIWDWAEYAQEHLGEREARTAAMKWPSDRKVNYPTPDTTNPTFTDEGEWVDEKSPLQKAFPKTEDYPEEMERSANDFWEDYQMFKIRKIPGHHSNESLDAHKYAFMWARNNEYDIPAMRELMDYMSKIGLFPQSTYDAWDQMVSYDSLLPYMHNDTA